jgi:cytoskeletal protein RodZ
MGTKTAPLPDLAELRAIRGLSLDEIARATHITMRYLQAIERGDFDKLPGGIYTRSYIRQYARAAGCDEAMLLDRYRDASDAGVTQR